MKLSDLFTRPQPQRKPQPAQPKPPRQTIADAKRAEDRAAALDRVEWAGAMIDRYSVLYDKIETELTSNPTLPQYKQIQLEKQLLQTEEKIRRLTETRNKAYYIAHRDD